MSLSTSDPASRISVCSARSVRPKLAAVTQSGPARNQYQVDRLCRLMWGGGSAPPAGSLFWFRGYAPGRRGAQPGKK